MAKVKVKVKVKAPHHYAIWDHTVLQGLYRHSSAFFQDFLGLAKTKFQGFPGLKNPFPGLSRKRSIKNIGCKRSKSAYTKSVISVPALK